MGVAIENNDGTELTELLQRQSQTAEIDFILILAADGRYVASFPAIDPAGLTCAAATRSEFVICLPGKGGQVDQRFPRQGRLLESKRKGSISRRTCRLLLPNQ